MPRPKVQVVLQFLGVAALLVGAGDGAPPAKTLTWEDARAHAQTRPRYLRPVPYTPVPTDLPDLTAATCGKCHVEIYEEWKVSTHARAWKDDLQFLAELEKSEKQGVGWLCMNCHTPLENQLPRLVAALPDDRWDRPTFVPNPSFDPTLQDEAITCATCHVEDGVILGPYGNTVAPHAVKKSDKLLSPEICTQCHQAQAQKLELSLICVFNTGAEWQASPQKKQGKICQSCHMPEVTRGLVGGSPPRRTRRHWFGGSLIPKQPAFAAELEPLLAHYPPGLAVRPAKAPKRLKPGQTTEWVVEIQNQEAGHYLPTGDPERFLLIVLSAKDGSGALLAQRTERIGIEYQWYPEIKKLSENRLAPKERRRYSLQFVAPAGGEVHLDVEASRWRISQQNLEYHHLEGRYVPGQTFYRDQQKVAVR